MRTLTYSKFTGILLLLFITEIFASGGLVYSRNGMVVSASELASQVGVEILKNGGNAIDAAVATGFALAVTYPSAGNIGGGGFMVIHLSSGKNTTIDFREKAPSKAHSNMFLDEDGNYDPQKSLKQWSAAGVPGTVAGLIDALDKYGTMELEQVIQPAIEIAENGFHLDYWLCTSINHFNEEFNQYHASQRIFTNEGDSLFEGQKFQQKDLAKSLLAIKENGAAGFYTGEIADLIISASDKNGGYFTMQDLIDYEPIEREPVSGNYKEYKVIGMPLPSSGGICVQQILSVFQKFEFDEDDFGSSDYIHTLTEIFKHVYADRSNYLGDTDFVDVPIDYLLSDTRVDEIFSQIGKNAKPSEEIEHDVSMLYEGNETTHYSVVDAYGNAVSTTVSINSSYGSKIVVDGTGFLLNNHMDDFTAKIGEKNQFGLVRK
ncbi:MAG: gamma-glutamyltransferase [Melioribacteraceae bacterium]|nr:gamma-glutamyltransferase [Melioribacteraceae bacterium]